MFTDYEVQNQDMGLENHEIGTMLLSYFFDFLYFFGS